MKAVSILTIQSLFHCEQLLVIRSETFDNGNGFHDGLIRCSSSSYARDRLELLPLLKNHRGSLLNKFIKSLSRGKSRSRFFWGSRSVLKTAPQFINLKTICQILYSIHNTHDFLGGTFHILIPWIRHCHCQIFLTQLGGKSQYVQNCFIICELHNIQNYFCYTSIIVNCGDVRLSTIIRLHIILQDHKTT